MVFFGGVKFTAKKCRKREYRVWEKIFKFGGAGWRGVGDGVVWVNMVVWVDLGRSG